MSKEIDNIFVDVRNAFRLLKSYQERILQIVSYIREQTPYTRMWGGRWYSDEIGTSRSPAPDYAKLKVNKDMPGWDFLYGYLFEYYFGKHKFGKKTLEMSIIQISDDGFFISNKSEKDISDLSCFESSKSSHSYIVFNVSVYTSNASEMWLSDPDCPDDGWGEFLDKFFSAPNDTKVTKNDKGGIVILKRYEMQRFTSQHETDTVIRDFGKILKNYTDIELFKSNFYE